MICRNTMKPRLYKQVHEPWAPWFAWRPVRVCGRWQWLQYVYRYPILKTYETINEPTRYEYGNIFDILTDDQQIL
jgi:hypothetical protein